MTTKADTPLNSDARGALSLFLGSWRQDLPPRPVFLSGRMCRRGTCAVVFRFSVSSENEYKYETLDLHFPQTMKVLSQTDFYSNF